jgi:proliferating cell nuclear antigen
MFKATITAENLKEFIEMVKTINSDIKLSITEDGIKTTAVDPANVALINAELPQNVFESYKAKPTEIGLDLHKLFDSISAASKDDKISLLVEENTSKLELQFGGFTFNIGLLDIGNIKCPRIPALQLDAHVNVPSVNIQKTIKAAEKVGDFVVVQTDSKKKMFTISTNNETDSLTGELGPSELLSVPVADGKCTISLEYLSSIVKSIKSKEMSISLGNDMPLIIDAPLAIHGSAHFMIAPRIESD